MNEQHVLDTVRRRRPRGCRGGKGRRRPYKALSDVVLDFAKPIDGSTVSGGSSAFSTSSIWDWRVYPPMEEDLFEKQQEGDFSDALLPLGLVNTLL